jgi:hypothetical protein
MSDEKNKINSFQFQVYTDITVKYDLPTVWITIIYRVFENKTLGRIWFYFTEKNNKSTQYFMENKIKFHLII